jgi:hypothetical protein
VGTPGCCGAPMAALDQAAYPVNNPAGQHHGGRPAEHSPLRGGT